MWGVLYDDALVSSTSQRCERGKKGGASALDQRDSRDSSKM